MFICLWLLDVTFFGSQEMHVSLFAGLETGFAGQFREK